MEFTIEYNSWEECLNLQRILIHVGCKWSKNNDQYDLDHAGIRLNLPDKGRISGNTQQYLYFSPEKEVTHSVGFFKYNKLGNKAIPPVKKDKTLYYFLVDKRNKKFISVFSSHLLKAGYSISTYIPISLDKGEDVYLLLHRTRTLPGKFVTRTEFEEIVNEQKEEIKFGLFSNRRGDTVAFFNKRSDI